MQALSKLFYLILLVFISLPAYAEKIPYTQMPKGNYVLDMSHTSLVWRVNHHGFSKYTARFTQMKADLNFNPEKPEDSSLTVIIDPSSVKTHYPYAEKKDFDKKLAFGEDWFNAKQFSEIIFKSSKIEKLSDHEANIHGDMTFLGMTKPVILKAQYNASTLSMPWSKKPRIGFSAQTKIKRSDWGFSTYVPNIGDDVEIWIEAEFIKEEE